MRRFAWVLVSLTWGCSLTDLSGYTGGAGDDSGDVASVDDADDASDAPQDSRVDAPATHADSGLADSTAPADSDATTASDVSPDAHVTDTASTDSSATETSVTDSSLADTHVTEASVTDSSPADTVVVDTNVADTTKPDSASATDTGTLPTDTGTPPTDTGTPPTDTGTPPTDTGTPPADTGTPPTDTGTTATDTGTPPTDTGTPPTDTGTPPTDTFVSTNYLWCFETTSTNPAPTTAQPDASATVSVVGATAATYGGYVDSAAGCNTATEALAGNHWDETSNGTTTHFEFVVTVGSGPLTFSFDDQASGTGPTQWKLTYDTGSGEVNATTTAQSTHSSFAGQSVSIPSLTSGGTVPVTFRLYGFGATSTSGTWRIDAVHLHS